MRWLLCFLDSVSMMLLSKTHEVNAVRIFSRSVALLSHTDVFSLVLATLQSYQLWLKCFYLTHNELCIAKRLSVAADVIGMSAVTEEKRNESTSLVLCLLVVIYLRAEAGILFIESNPSTPLSKHLNQLQLYNKK